MIVDGQRIEVEVKRVWLARIQGGACARDCLGRGLVDNLISKFTSKERVSESIALRTIDKVRRKLGANRQ